MPNVSTLTVRLSANSSKLVAEFSKAQRRARTFSQRVGGSLRVVARRFGALSLAGATGLAALTAAGTKTADELAKTADKLGLAANELAGLRFAAEQTGVGVKQLDLGLQRMVRRVAEAAKGTGEAKNALKELNLNAKELTRLSPDEQFKRVADAFELLGNQSDKVRLGFKLFDSEGVGLVNTLKAGRDGLNEFRVEAEKLGLTLNRTQLKNIQEAADAQNKLSKSFSGLGQQLSATFAPAMEAASEATADFVSQITRSIPKLADYASAVLGISRAVDDLALAEARSELGAVFNELVNARSELIELQESAEGINPFSEFGSTGIQDALKAAGENVARLTVRSQQLQRRLQEAGEEAEKVAHVFGPLPSGTGNGRSIFEQASRQLDEVIAKQEKLASSAASIFAQTRTPVERYVSALTEAAEALRKGLIDEETFNRFAELWQKKIIEPVEELDDAAKKAAKSSEEAARDLGFTFESAFEKAVLEGNKLRDVLKGLLKDILRIVLRKTVTEKIGNFITDIFTPKAPTSGTGESLVAATAVAGAGSIGGGSQKPILIQQSFTVEAGVTATELNEALPPLLEQNKQDTIATFAEMKVKRQI